jgi:hypothetical protein
MPLLAFPLLVILTLALSLFPLFWPFKGKAVGRLDWLGTVLVSTGLVTFTFLAGAWVFISYYLRFLLPILFAWAVWKSRRRVAGFPMTVPKGSVWRRVAAKFLLALILFGLNGLVIRDYFYKGESVDLSFPLRDGAYVVLQGGNNPASNFFHYTLSGQKSALDLVKLHGSGNRASRLFSTELSSYRIFGEPVFSPCRGIVAVSVDGWPDNPPGRIDRKNPSGNHIVIRCKGARVVLSHLMNGSVTVRAEDSVKEGQPIGRVGSSGSALEPNLHIGARKDRAESPSASVRHEGIPMRFSGRVLTINDLFLDRRPVRP